MVGNQYALTMYSPSLRCLFFSTYTFKAFFWVLLFLVLAAHAYYFTERDSVEQVKVRRVGGTKEKLPPPPLPLPPYPPPLPPPPP